MRTIWGAAALIGCTCALADDVAGIRNDTTQGRQLLKAALPEYPREEQGRWTPSCVSLYFTVRPDGKTDGFVVLEAPTYGHANSSELKTKADQLADSRVTRQFVQNDLQALYSWQYAPAPKATDEIAVFSFTRSVMGGRIMDRWVRRMDLGSSNARGCAEPLDPKEVTSKVGKARGKAG